MDGIQGSLPFPHLPQALFAAESLPACGPLTVASKQSRPPIIIHPKPRLLQLLRP
jgi:hypothetical protein